MIRNSVATALALALVIQATSLGPTNRNPKPAKPGSFDLAVLRTKNAIMTLTPKGVDEALAYYYAALIARTARTHSLDPLKIVAVAYHESRFGANTISKTNDYGLMGINWHYVGRHHVNNRRQLLEPKTNIEVATKELKYWQEFVEKTKSPWSPLDHYNQGVRPQSNHYSRKITEIHARITSALGQNGQAEAARPSKEG